MNTHHTETTAELDQIRRQVRQTEKRARLAAAGAISALVLTTLININPAGLAQTPGINLAQLVAQVSSLQSTVASQGKTITTLQTSLAAETTRAMSAEAVLQSRATALETKTAPLSLSNDPSAGGVNTLLTITGVNVQIVNGQGSTETANGLGNLIVGYNETDPNFTQNRTGSHNFVVGMGNNYLSYGGLVAGESNDISGPFATVTGGYENVASSGHASVSGGSGNIASGGSASVSGGSGNVAKADYSSISGGYQNTAEANDYTSVSGGYQNVAYGEWAAVSGGYQNLAGGEWASVCGGNLNKANGIYSTVTGGEFNTTGGIATSISGGAHRNQSTNDGWTAGSDAPNSSDYIGDFRSP